MKNIKTITVLSMFLAIAIVLNVIEIYYPLLNYILPIPGAKIGFANIVTVIVLYLYGFRQASLLTVLRVLMVGLFSRSFTVTFWMGLGGAILSLLVMGMLKKWFKLHPVTVSVMGAVSHTIGQVIVGMYMLDTGWLILYLPVMLLISIPAGILIGLIAQRFFKVFGNTPHPKTF